MPSAVDILQLLNPRSTPDAELPNLKDRAALLRGLDHGGSCLACEGLMGAQVHLWVVLVQNLGLDGSDVSRKDEVGGLQRSKRVSFADRDETAGHCLSR
jgi:hypothetical protein